MLLKYSKYLIIALSVALNILLYRGEIGSLFSTTGQNLIRSDDISANRATFDKFRTDALEYSGWSETDKVALTLDPGSDGTAIYKYQKPDNAKVVTLETSFYRPYKGTNAFYVSTDDKNWQLLINNTTSNENAIDISNIVGSADVIYIKIDVKNDYQSPLIAVQSIRLNYFKQKVEIPELSFILTSFVLPFIFIRFNILALLPIVIMAFLKLFLLHSLYLPSDLPYKYSLVLQMLALLFFAAKKKSISPLMLLAVVSLGLHLSLSALYQNRYLPLEPDVFCMINSINSFDIRNLKTGLFGTFCRTKESGILLIYLTFFKFFGFGSELAIRYSSIFFHILTIALAFFYGNKIGSKITGLTASILLATHPYLITLSTRGLRDTAFTFSALMLVYFLFEKNLSILKNKIGIIVSMIMIIFLRLNSLIQFFPVILISSFSKKGFVLLFTLFFVASPIILTNLKFYKTWNYSEQTLVNWDINMEFKGKPGYPSIESIAYDSNQGGRSVNSFTYLFKLHTVKDLMFSWILGMVKTFKQLYFTWGNDWLFPLFILGSVLMIKKRSLWYIPFLVFFLEVPHFFLIQKSVAEYRSVTHSIPFIALAIGYGLEETFKKIFKLI